MSDDPNRARCPKCFGWMSKERVKTHKDDGKSGNCYLCDESPTGKWEPRLPRIFTAPRKEDRTGLLEET